MGQVIKLAFNRESKSRTEMPAGHKCQVILLPCVRYERWETAPAKPKAPVKKPRKRRARAR